MRDWEQCFVSQSSPVLRSQLLAALMAGTQIEADRVPVPALLDAVVLATTARNYCEAEIVDDYQRLLERAKEERLVDGRDGHCRMHQIHQISFILDGVADELTAPEDQYLERMVTRFLSMEPPAYSPDPKARPCRNYSGPRQADDLCRGCGHVYSEHRKAA